MSWADDIRTLKVRTNADNPRDAKQAVDFGAEGIGLCRTEHMFFEEERIPAIRRMIMADTEEERREKAQKWSDGRKTDDVTQNAEHVFGDEPAELYAASAVLMDADSGRVLYGKNADVVRPMASTTKIMTCILALEYLREHPDQTIEVSDQAASQPKVHLGMQKGEVFYIKDLLYSLMLESHNDSAVAVAEALPEV